VTTNAGTFQRADLVVAVRDAPNIAKQRSSNVGSTTVIGPFARSRVPIESVSRGERWPRTRAPACRRYPLLRAGLFPADLGQSRSERSACRIGQIRERQSPPGASTLLGDGRL
jgi:hypothetical protein